MQFNEKTDMHTKQCVHICFSRNVVSAIIKNKYL